ncbi:hypothetical protein BD324DRAFT_649340 [Kockovaella imperatae]|uniref:Translation initiation factor eIF 4e-like domain-containing protein n=1 Tax=Kockovaella imperatae TaxID=4999 RepID=A0A1Y1UNY8_9TREE|nr:hypothetical protein BD324DRAFT_649340 [Kockovaella imperatae]ORX39257.1 hypothetical protein BD324DRAFT_649340 [Kockovaella imperatae]
MTLQVSSIDMSTSSSLESQHLVTPVVSQVGMSDGEQKDLLKKDNGESNTESSSNKPIITKAVLPLPPHLDVNIVSPTPPKSTRLPSLRQLSDHLSHSPSPLYSSSSSATSLTETPTSGTPSQLVDKNLACTTNSATPDLSRPRVEQTPPKLKVAINPSAIPPTTTTTTSSSSPSFTASPSGRLKLPISAMTRTHSSSSTSSASHLLHHPLPPIPPFGTKIDKTGDKPLTPLEKNTDLFGPVPAPSMSPSDTSMSRGPSVEGYIKGYKDVPSLAAIRERVSFSKASGKIAGEALKSDPGVNAGVPQDKENVNPTISPALSSPGKPKTAKAQEHPLEHAWTLYFDAKSFKPPPGLSNGGTKEGQSLLGDYEKSLVTVGRFDTVEGFARHVNNVRLPSSLSKNSNYHLFKDGIRPMWEDPANANGGKWVILLKNAPALLDHSWANLTMGLVGEILDPDDEVCGVVASTKPKVDRIQIWTRDRKNVDRLNRLGQRIVDTLSLDGKEMEVMSMEFQYNISNPNPPPNLFFHIPFAGPRSASFSGGSNLGIQTSLHAPPTPSRLGTPTSPLTGHSSLPAVPKSPTLSALSNTGHHNLPGGIPSRTSSPAMPRSPTSGFGQSKLGAPIREVRRLSAGHAFAGPMGGGTNGTVSTQGKSGLLKKDLQTTTNATTTNSPVVAGIR